MAFLRKNAWNHGGTFENPDLLWYAKAVGVMKSRPINDCTSWWFYGAIHGQYLIDNPWNGQYPNWKKIPSIPASANLGSMDTPNALTKLFWDQCQHGSWFFLPWHRGYLAALENILRDIIVKELKGPADWALPYWNYLNQSKKYDQSRIPPAFTQPYLPDGTTPNPLHIPERYGLKGDGTIYTEKEGDYAISEECQTSSTFVTDPNSEVNTGYGGPKTGFSHAHKPHGVLESNPHDHVHISIGGFNHINIDTDETSDEPSKSNEGFMCDGGTAALDPIFYIHHSNIDRMWTVWNNAGNKNPNDPAWLVGPESNAERGFAMSMDAKGTAWTYNSQDVNSTTLNYYNGAQYQYTYDDLALTSQLKFTLGATINQRLMKLGVAKIDKEITMTTNNNDELVGASLGSLTLNNGTTETSVQLDKQSWKSVSKSLLEASATSLPDEVYLVLDEVTGINNSNFLSVYVNDIFVKSVALFGIRLASMKNRKHGGSGLAFEFNISNIIDDMHIAGKIDVKSLKVQIKMRNPILGGSELKIGSIRVYRVDQ